MRRALAFLCFGVCSPGALVFAQTPPSAQIATPTGNPPGSSYGPNISGPARPYLGPRTPPGPTHPYHFQVFALDRTLPADSIDTFTTLLELAKGHVLASGELVGVGSADAK